MKLSSQHCQHPLRLRAARDEDLLPLWQLIYHDQEWKEHDAPFLPLQLLDIDAFAAGPFKAFKKGDQGLLIEYQGELIGTLSYFWKSNDHHWLDVGITLYPQRYRNRKLGQQALELWVRRLFRNYPQLSRIGLATWSGNPAMIRCAEKVGFKVEGQLRQTYLYQGQGFDAIVMGLLRHELCAAAADH